MLMLVVPPNYASCRSSDDCGQDQLGKWTCRSVVVVAVAAVVVEVEEVAVAAVWQLSFGSLECLGKQAAGAVLTVV